jgi:hypothetical protein
MTDLPKGMHYSGNSPDNLAFKDLTVGVHIWFKNIEELNPYYASNLENYIISHQGMFLIFEEDNEKPGYENKFVRTVERFANYGKIENAIFVKTEQNSPMLQEADWKAISTYLKKNDVNEIKLFGGMVRSMYPMPQRLMYNFLNVANCLGYVNDKLKKEFKTQYLKNLVFM